MLAVTDDNLRKMTNSTILISLSGTNRERKKGRAEFGKKLIIYEGTMGITGRSRPRYKSL